MVADLSHRSVAITTTFTGSEILIFGAVKRAALSDSPGRLDVIITVTGPTAPATVRKKDRVAGIWVNMDQRERAAVPTFYGVMTSAPLADILSPLENRRYRISPDQAIGPEDESVGAVADEFDEALIRLREAQDSYQVREGSVRFTDETLFRTSMSLPANLTEGDYRADIYLTRNSQVISTYVTKIAVTKVGLERFLYRLAHDRPLIYGLMSLFIAIAAGWLASAAFRLVKL
ncbi:MAG: TIGR02186 family protein [Pseudomonadota bacterium]